MRKFLKSFVYAFRGIIYSFKTQLNFRIECFAAIVVVLLGYFVKLNRSEWLWVSLAIIIVLVLELINTAIEVLVDLVSPTYHPKAGVVKDAASAAVLVASVFAIIVALFIFLPKLN